MASSEPPISTAALAQPSSGARETEAEAFLTLRATKVTFKLNLKRVPTNERCWQRKLDDAFQSLDNAVSSPEIQLPPPQKRPNTIRSLYSTLAKYGIKRKESQPEPSQAPEQLLPTTSKSTPHLSAIVARAAARTRKALPFKFSSSSSAPPLPPTADYRPSSLTTFLARLSTFKLSTYANKPSSIDAVAASKCGWTNDGKDRLVCGLCRASWIVVGRDGMNKDAANSLLEKQRTSLVDAHKDGCPWRTRQCDASIYCIPLQSPANMVKDIKDNALALDTYLRNIEIKHPLTSTQISSLQSTLSAVTVHTDTPSQPLNTDNLNPSDQDEGNVFLTTSSENENTPSNSAILTSLFGWSIAPPTPPEQSRKTSLTRASSISSTAPHTPSISRSSSVRPMSPVPFSSPSVRQGTPATPTRLPSSQFTFRMSSNVNVKSDTILHCTLCQRRIGLWAFTPEVSTTTTTTELPSDSDTAMQSPAGSPPKKSATRRLFDVLKEHRAYCPYVVRSTTVPTLPVPPPSVPTGSSASLPRPSTASTASLVHNQNTVLEGWRAVLTVVLRYGVVQKHRLGLDFAERLRGDTADESMEVDGVKAMVAGVKKRGGKDLLQYVKGLLG
ncbi:hypothetical protein H0H93_012637 [Arthromyces matolae]|nr:hypothetical protein H0H93_012637 [Arthromyces matolae]